MFKDLPFEIEESLGFGATSHVVSAQHKDTREKVALKIFKSDGSLDQRELEHRFQKESEALLMLEHPNIVRFHRFWKTEKTLCLEMELIEGGSLREWMNKDHLQFLDPRYWVLVQVARAVSAIHEAQLLHRDLKPSNILIDPKSGMLKVIDFGLVKELGSESITQTGTLLGSLKYMAPEVYRGEPHSVQSDIYSFGVLAHELLSLGDFGEPSIEEILNRKVPPLHLINPRIPKKVSEFVSRCLEPDPSKRLSYIPEAESLFFQLLSSSQTVEESKGLVTGHCEVGPYLLKKNSYIKKEIHSILKNRKEKLPISVINEFAFLFPNDPYLKTLPRAKADTDVRKSSFQLAIPFLLTLFVSIIWSFPLSELPVEPPQYKPILKPPVPENKPIKKVIKRAPAVKPFGWIQVNSPKDVQVFIDGKKYLPNKKHPVPSGTRKLVLKKKGYDDIRTSISVKKGKVATINIGKAE